MAVNVSVALGLFKTALGVTHGKRDDYFISMLTAAHAELAGRGVVLDLDRVEDNMLLADYAEFCYRNRDGAKEMPRNLELRIRNRKARGRVDRGT